MLSSRSGTGGEFLRIVKKKSDGEVRSVKSVGAGKSGRDNADAVKGCSGTTDR
jgi:hypothetical protein